MAKAKRPPKMKADPLQKYTDARKAASAYSRKPTERGTFAQGPRSANSSNGTGRGIRRDSKGRFT